MKMRKILLTSLFLFIVVFAFADYYDGVINLTGQSLYFGLRTLISTNTNTSYDGSKEHMFGYMDNTNGLVRCVYTGQDWSVPVGGMPNQNNFNCEHTYAQSWFSSTDSSKKKADLHHLFPTNAGVNSSRGNLPFGTVINSNATYVSYNGYVSKRGTTSQGTTVFEPANQHKGNLARALLYFNTRYNDSLNQQNVNMMETLIAWHNLDPVDDQERARNQSIYVFQHNRNPYVDHPEFVQRIWGPVPNDDETNSPVFELTIDEPYPNPFVSSTSIGYNLKSSSDVNIQVYNVKGQLVRSFTESKASSGAHSITWDGMDSESRKCASGVYMIRILSDKAMAAKKVLLQN
jgi:hypothetical protein